MTDDEIRKAIEASFQVEFDNYGGDSLMEGPCNNDEEAYDRALDLLEGAKLQIVWPSN